MAQKCTVSLVSHSEIHNVAVWPWVQGEATGQLGSAQVVPRPSEASSKDTHPNHRKRTRSSSSGNSEGSWGFSLGQIRGHLGLAQEDFPQAGSVYPKCTLVCEWVTAVSMVTSLHCYLITRWLLGLRVQSDVTTVVSVVTIGLGLCVTSRRGFHCYRLPWLWGVRG